MHPSTTCATRTPRRAVVARTTPLEALFIAVLVLGFVAALALPAMARDRVSPDIDTVSIRVKDADTLWDIARRHDVPGLTTAQTVALIREINALDTALLIAGQSLAVPQPPGEQARVASAASP